MHRGRFFWGLVLLLFGTLLLLNNLGLLPVDVWSLLGPLFLILLGVSVLWGTFFRRSAPVERVEVPLDGAERARVKLRHGAGRLQITSGAPANDLLDGDFGGGLRLDKRQQGDLLLADLSLPSNIFPFSWVGDSLDWNVRLNQNIPLELDVEGGANKAEIDLRELRVSDLRLQSGASASYITMPADAGFTRAEVKTGAASVEIVIPESVAGRIRVQSGLGAIDVDDMRFKRSGNEYMSPQFHEAPNKVDIFIETGVGSVKVR